MSYDVFEAQTFWDCVMSMQRDDGTAPRSMESLIELRRQPFRNPVLQTHDVGIGLNGRKVFSSDVGGRAQRPASRLAGVQQDARRRCSTAPTPCRTGRSGCASPSTRPTGSSRCTSRRPTPASSAPYQQQRVERRPAVHGLDRCRAAAVRVRRPTSSSVLRRLNTDDELLAARARARRRSDFERAVQPRSRTATPTGAATRQPSTGRRGRRARGDRGGPRARAPARSSTIAPVRGSRAPSPSSSRGPRPADRGLDDLPPSRPAGDGRRATSRARPGCGARPARARPSSGCTGPRGWPSGTAKPGETKPVLFTTFIKSLPPVFESLYLRLPGTRAGEVEFVHIDRLAWQVCAAARRPADDRCPRDIDAAFATAFKRIVSPGTPLADAGFSRQYLRDEITAVDQGPRARPRSTRTWRSPAPAGGRRWVASSARRCGS